MYLETISQKQFSELEQRVRDLLILMQKLKLQNPTLLEPLKTFERELGEARRERFDATNSEYQSY